MFTVVEIAGFIKQAEKLFDETEKQELINFLAENPEAGSVIPGTGGIRKLRFAASGRGTRGGARIIYFYYDERVPLYALAAYAKNQKEDLDPKTKKVLTQLADIIKKAARSEK